MELVYLTARAHNGTLRYGVAISRTCMVAGKTYLFLTLYIWTVHKRQLSQICGYAYSSLCIVSLQHHCNPCSHQSLRCLANTKRNSDYILVKCWSGVQGDEYQSTSGSGKDGESDISDINEGRTGNLSSNNGK